MKLMIKVEKSDMKKLFIAILLVFLISCESYRCYRCYSTTTTTYDPNIPGYPKVEIGKETMLCDISDEELIKIVKDSTYRITITSINECTGEKSIKTITKYYICN